MLMSSKSKIGKHKVYAEDSADGETRKQHKKYLSYILNSTTLCRHFYHKFKLSFQHIANITTFFPSSSALEKDEE